jgi:hypothetical protein
VGCLIFSGLLATIEIATAAEVPTRSNLARFYGSGKPLYVFAFGVETGEAACNGETEVRMGVQTDDLTFVSPTKIAVRGLEAALAGKLGIARKCAAALNAMAIEIDGGIFFPFRTDYVSTWPYELRAPWVSALTQGAALGLFTELAAKTGEAAYKDRARLIYKSYNVPVERGGFARKVGQDEVLLEEYPTAVPTAVMNGGLVATLALIDYEKFSKDNSARRLISDVVQWWERNIHRYDLNLPWGNVPGSAYSLGPRRLDVLFRFVLSARPVDIFSIEFTAKDIQRTILVGSPADGEIAMPAHLLLGNAYMNWSGRKYLPQRGSYRSVVPGSGKWNHAPFALQLAHQVELAAFQGGGGSITIRYASDALLDLQVFDGTEYHKIGTLPSTNNEVKQVEFPLPAAPFSKLIFPLNFAFDEKYLDDNYELLGLLADAVHSTKLRKFSQRWRDSGQFVPYEALNDLPKSFFQQYSASPLIGLLPSPSEESIHVEYPTVFGTESHRIMLYSAYGDDSRWRIKSAVSQDNNTWVRQGNVFNEMALPFAGNYAFPFVDELPAKSTNKYALYFAAGNMPKAPYTALWKSLSRDGVTWLPPIKLFEDRLILDPVITELRGRKVAIYTSKCVQGDCIRLVALNNGIPRKLLQPVTLWRPKTLASGVGIYTLGLLPSGQKKVLVIEAGLPGRIDWIAKCFDARGRLIPAARGPIASFPKSGERWDSLKYGQFFHDAKGSNLSLYYNGIMGAGAERGGQIGHADIDRAVLETLVSTAACH